MATSLGRTLLTASVLVFAALPVRAQEPPLSATLLKRLAAAADDYRTGDSVYAVAAYAFPHNLIGVFPNLEQAQAARRRAGMGYGLFGPFVTAQDFGRRIVLLTRPRHCPGTIFPCYDVRSVGEPETPWFAHDIDSVAVTVFHNSGDIWRSVANGLGVDAIFFTLAAFDKFALPYYSRLYGPAQAAALRDSITAPIDTIPR